MPPQADETIHASWIRLQDGRATGGIKQGDLAQAAEDIGGDPLTVYVPALDVLLTRVKLPGGRRSQLLTALPYALEDNLVDNVEALHCALGPRLETGDYVAAVVAEEKMQQWQSAMQQAGLRPQVLLPDTMLLPWTPGSWSLHCQQSNVWVRTGMAEGFVCTAGSLPFLLQQAATEQSPRNLTLYGCADLEQEVLAAALGDVTIDVVAQQKTTPEPGLTLVVQHGITPSGLNLLQGNFAPHSRLKQQLRPWYPAAALAGVWLILMLAGDISEYLTLKRQSEQLQQQIVEVFRKTFPQIKRVVNPQAQMRHHLNQLRGNSEGEGSFTTLLAQIAPAAAKMKNVHIKNLRYHQGQMELLLELPDLQSLETLKRRMSEATTWRVELKSANASDNKVQGRIQISRP